MTCPAWARWLLCLVALLCLVTSADAQAQAGNDGADSLETAEPARFIPAPEAAWRWRQMLASPRIGGRLTSVSIDPQREGHIFVGTEEGTLLRSTDGGVTWTEHELGPVVSQGRSLHMRSPGLPRLGQPSRPGLAVFVEPPFRPGPVGRVSASFPNLFFSLRPSFVFAGVLPETSSAPNALLGNSVRRRTTYPVRRIAVCPGSLFPLLVATSTEVLASPDDGRNWVRLLRVPGRVPVTNIVCDPADPAHIVVTTGFGMFRSRDAGLSFDQDLGGWPGRRATAVAVRSEPGQSGSQVFVATGHVLFAGDPDSDAGLERRYPDFNNSETAPWRTIRWVDFAGDEVWIGTNDGARVSRDAGRSWSNVAPNLFSRQIIAQVAAGYNDAGGARVALLTRDCPSNRSQRSGSGRGCRTSRIYATDDGGQTWFPFFNGMTRRTIQQMVAAPASGDTAPRWWVVTGGELWATVESGQVDDAVNREASAWAGELLRQTPPMSLVIDTVLDNLELSADRVESLADRSRRRYLFPRIDALANFYDGANDRREESRPISASVNDRVNVESIGGLDWDFFVYATWNLDRMPLVSEDYGSARNNLYEMQRQISFAIEDAWHERNMHLRRISRGMSDELQIAILKERIEALEVVLELWLDGPLSSLGD